MQVFDLTPKDIIPATDEEKAQKVKMRESVTYWQDAIARFKKNKVAMLALGIIVLVTLFALIGPMLSPYTYDQQIRGSEYQKPSIEHPFGTDNLGRDMLVRTMMGTRISLAIGFFCAVIVLIVGTIYGSVAGYAGGRTDNIMMRICEILYSVPDLLLIILLKISLEDYLKNNFPALAGMVGIVAIFLAFAFLYWVNMARMVRGQILQLKQNEYVLAARAMGGSSGHVIRKHLIPNAVGVILVTTMFQIPTAIFTESFLSFIGIGVSRPMASLGSLANSALAGMRVHPHLIMFPAAMIALIILSFNLFGDGLRDALDPRLKS